MRPIPKVRKRYAVRQSWLCTCGRYWSGQAQQHCQICHEHFSTYRNYMTHFAGRTGRCLDPAHIVGPDGGPYLVEGVSRYGPMWVRRERLTHLTTWRRNAAEEEQRPVHAGMDGEEPG